MASDVKPLWLRGSLTAVLAIGALAACSSASSQGDSGPPDATDDSNTGDSTVIVVNPEASDDSTAIDAGEASSSNEDSSIIDASNEEVTAGFQDATADAPKDATSDAALLDAPPSTNLVFNPVSTNFGTIPWGQPSPAATFTLTNTSSQPAGSLQLGVAGSNAGDFAQTNNCGTSLVPDASCTIQVTADPTAVGLRNSALVANTSSGGGASATLYVTGDYSYHDVGDATKWATFNTIAVDPNGQGFGGTTFDGRYIYFAPSGAGLVLRYDTQGSLSGTASWTIFDLTPLNSNLQWFQGATFDGRYVYLVPNTNGSARIGLAARYDTHANFADATSWSIFDIATVNTNAKGFGGASFDGRYLYFVPFASVPGTLDGVVARYDTQASFTASTSWVTFDTTTVNAYAKGYQGAVFDGRYLYLVPFDISAGVAVVARYDTQGPFASGSSWLTFDVTKVNPNAKGFYGGGFDGRYIYLVPFSNDAGIDGIVARYDTQSTFAAVSSWTTFDATTINANAKGFYTASFDGRYLYLVPFANNVLVRYDTNSNFIDAGSWGAFDVSTVNASVAGFGSAAFDGRYVYLGNQVLARFDAKQPLGMPHLCANSAALYCFTGSFF
jgi:hypothetical protein